MNDPYETLGLRRDADESEIRRRYLELVREFPPDRAPERFTAVHAAYEAVRDPARRLESRLFQTETTDDSFEAIANDLRSRLRQSRLPVDALLKLADSP
jgi:curved DNA-binding protein CbpA